MATFLLVFRHPHNYVGTSETPAAWVAWFKELGANLEDPGNPVFERTTIGNCGTDAHLGGYMLITAIDFDALANRCPIMRGGGGVEVGKLTPVPGRQHPARDF